jgi:ABC-type sugar transport system ATPase subunit
LLITTKERGAERARFEVGSSLANRLSSLVGKDVAVGFRPEHVTVRLAGPPALPGAEAATTTMDAWSAVVDLCEPLGHENLLHLSRAGVPFTVRTPGEQMFSPGQKVTASVPPEAIYLFDAANDGLLVEQTGRQTV